jgi:hypothetical protein
MMTLSHLDMILWGITVGLGIVLLWIIYKKRERLLENFEDTASTGEDGVRFIEGETGVFMDASGITYKAPTNPEIKVKNKWWVYKPIANPQYTGPEGADVAFMGCGNFRDIFYTNNILINIIRGPPPTFDTEEERVKFENDISGNPLIPDVSDPFYEVKVGEIITKMNKARDDFNAINCTKWGFEALIEDSTKNGVPRNA